MIPAAIVQKEVVNHIVSLLATDNVKSDCGGKQTKWKHYQHRINRMSQQFRLLREYRNSDKRQLDFHFKLFLCTPRSSTKS